MGARQAGVVLAAAACVTLAACGSRLPHSEFSQSGAVVEITALPAGASLPAGVATVLPGGSLPTGSATGGAQTTGAPGAASTPAGLPGALSGTGTAPTAGATASTGSTKTSPGKSSKPGASTGPSAAAGAGNTASDRGVSATAIEVGNIVSSGGEFGAYEFTPNYYGAAAYFANLNAHGGVHGRLIDFKACPDNGDASSNVKAVHTCIDTDKVFAFAGNNIFDYSGASYVQSQDVPDIGGEPVDAAYDTYSHLYSISGNTNPRNGQTGYADGKAFTGAQIGAFFKTSVGVKHLGVVYYNESSSEKGANEIAGEFSAAGVTTSNYSVNLGLPNFSAAVAQMQADGVDAVADELDENGNQKLCQAIEQNSSFQSQLKAKVSTEASWTVRFANDFASTPDCRDKSYAAGLAANYDDTSLPGVQDFRTTFEKYFPNSQYLAEWAVHGWIAAMWLTDAISSCGADVARACVEKFMNSSTKYGAGGLLDPAGFASPPESTYSTTQSTDCVSVAQFSGGHWVTRATIQKNCYTTPWFGYQDSS